MGALYARALHYQCENAIQVLGFVPIQIANLSLQEVELNKYTYIGVASPIQVNDACDCEGYVVNSVDRTHNDKKSEFRGYLQEKLAHLDVKDRYILEPVLQ